MRKLLLSVLGLLLCLMTLHAQPETMEPIRWIMGGGLGGNIALGKSTSGHPTDQLTKFPSSGSNTEAIHISRFFRRGAWGVHLSVQINGNESNMNSTANFEKTIKDVYGSNYTVSFSGYGADPERAYANYLAGPAYKAEYGRVVVIGKLLGGFTQFRTGVSSVNMKETGGNGRKEISWEPTKSDASKSIAMALVSPGVMVGYRFTKRLMGAAEAGYSYGRTKFEYRQSTIDNSGETVNQYFPYTVTLSNITLGVKFLITF